MPSWIDFKELRAQLDFEAVLVHYGVEVNRRGDQHMGFCPLPSHNGKRNSPSFSANLERGIFHCFGCQAKGNVLDFAALMSREDPKDGRALKKVALELQAKFCPKGDGSRSPRTETTKQDEPPAQMELAAVVNEPLDFTLQGLDSEHPYLKERGFSKETVAHFGIGYCARGSLAGRIAIPLHDATKQLVGYAGRVVDDDAIAEDNPRYLFPSKRERSGRLLEFRKSLFLYNGHRLTAPVADLIVVEGFPSVWWLTQHGHPDTVATMGAECSDEQAELIVSCVRPKGHIWVIPDGDKAGERFAQTLLAKLSPRRFIRWVKLQPGQQPTDLIAAELERCFTS